MHFDGICSILTVLQYFGLDVVFVSFGAKKIWFKKLKFHVWSESSTRFRFFNGIFPLELLHHFAAHTFGAHGRNMSESSALSSLAWFGCNEISKICSSGLRADALLQKGQSDLFEESWLKRRHRQQKKFYVQRFCGRSETGETVETGEAGGKKTWNILQILKFCC